MSHVYNSGRSYHAVAQWTRAGGGWVPPNEAVEGGYDVGGERIYVGRALQDGDCIPGKVVPSHGCCYVAYGGREHSHSDYQVLTSNSGHELAWINASGSDIPTGAVQGGVTADGEPLFIGRHEHEGSWVIGKVHPSHGSLYIPFGGEEHAYSEYEILCVRRLHL